MEMYVEGVSTRKVEEVTEELCGTSFSKSLISSLAGSGRSAIPRGRLGARRASVLHYPSFRGGKTNPQRCPMAFPKR